MSHLSLEERLKIELGLKQNKSLNEIAKELKRPLCTISREIYRNRTKSYKIPRDRIINRCIHRFGCELEHLCSDKSCHRKCRSCNLCNEVCHNFKGELCKKLEEKPFVCTNCPEEHKCVLIKYYYQHDEADKK